MNKSIIVSETKTAEWITEDVEYTYEYLLDLFEKDSLVYKLVQRCQEYEQEIERLTYDLQKSKLS